MHFATLTNLPGVKRRPVKAVPFLKRTNGLRALIRYRAAITAGDHGAINIWKDDAGQYRADFSRRMCRLDEQTFPSKRALAAWLKEWMPKAGL